MTKHAHLWTLHGRPSKPSRGPLAKAWAVRYRCATCRATKRVACRAEFWELRSGLA